MSQQDVTRKGSHEQNKSLQCKHNVTIRILVKNILFAIFPTQMTYARDNRLLDHRWPTESDRIFKGNNCALLLSLRR